MVDIYCTSGKCPICSRDIETTSSIDFIGSIVTTICCKNNCYLIKTDNFSNTFYIHVFGKLAVVINTRNDTKRLLEEKAMRRINYWRENDKYLAEILERS